MSKRSNANAPFGSQIMNLWAYQNGVKIDFSRPGKPTDNAYVESFNGRLRAECLDTHWFGTLEEAKETIEDWRREYNESRPHRALGERPPRTNLPMRSRRAAISWTSRQPKTRLRFGTKPGPLTNPGTQMVNGPKSGS
jgi:transposase InsO family protein